MMKHKGYCGVIRIDEDAGILVGDVIGLRDVITFQGRTVAEAKEAFRDSVNDCLEFCASRGEPPEKPFSGKFLVRIEPALHRVLAVTAEARGVSLNALVASTLAEAFEMPGPVGRPRGEAAVRKGTPKRSRAAK